MSKLKVHYELQTTKLELLQGEVNLLAAVNHAANCRIGTLEDVVQNIGRSCSYCDFPLKPDSMKWQSMEKVIGT